VEDGKLLHTLACDSPRCFGAAYNGAGTRLVTSGAEGSVQLWDPANGTLLKAARTGQQDVYGIGFRPVTGEIVTGGNQSVQFWDPELTHATRGLSGRIVARPRFTLDGKGLLTARYGEQELDLLDLDTFHDRHSFSGHTKPITCFALSRDGQRLVTGSMDGSVKLWDVVSGQETFSIPGADVRALAIRPDGQQIAVASFGLDVRLYDCSHGMEREGQLSSGH
jgi:WD40 repeat protein